MKATSLVHDWYPEPLPRNVGIGTGSWLYSAFAFVHFRSVRPNAVRIGNSCGIYNGSFFELGPAGEITIGDYSTLVGVIITTNGRVSIGSYCFLAHEVVIADVPVAVPVSDAGSPPMTLTEPAVSVTLGDNVWVGAGAVLLKGARVGDGAIIGAAAVVDFEVPPNSIVVGNPATIVGIAKGAE